MKKSVPNKKISDLLRLNSRFFRSVHLERDFRDPDALSGYILTDHTRSCLERMAEGLKEYSGQRAWRITGNYGSGKSSFALFLSRWFSGQELPLQIQKATDYHQFTGVKPDFVPVLITGSREPLGLAILKALHYCVSKLYVNGRKPSLLDELESCLQLKEETTDDQILNLVLAVSSKIITDNKGKGLLLILDELGKFLEFSALYPERQDVYLLQRLAEIASRSAEKPLFIVGLLHQGFSTYADQLSQSGQREWEKISARFEEIVFNQPIEQISTLVANALSVHTNLLPKEHFIESQKSMELLIQLGWFGSAPAKKVLLENASKLYPMHPTVLPILVRLFSRFGQNERSLFSFLLSNEPFGLQAFAERYVTSSEYYRLHNLYEYIRFNFGCRLGVQSYRSHWNQIDSMIESFATEHELELNILKTVGILNLFNCNDLLATEETITLAIAGTNSSNLITKQIRATLDNLQKGKRVLYRRGVARGFCLWPHTSVGLEEAYERASQVLGTLNRIADMVKDYIELRPIVARRHYIQTGNLRYFEVHYCSAAELVTIFNMITSDADGMIIVPLCETPEERSLALKFVMQSELKDRPEVLIAIPPPLNALVGLLQEAQRWEWIASNTPELNTDHFAAEEVSRQKNASRTSLENRIQGFIGLRQLTGHLSLEWYQQNNKLKISSGRELLSTLSDICDKIYFNAPQIKNELVNRHSISSSAAAARMRLIERMLTAASKPFLGMEPNKKPPEMSIYLSFLKASGIHQQYGKDWKIDIPSSKREDPCNTIPTLRKIEEIVKKKPDSKIPTLEIFNTLKKPPYGVKSGVIPIFLAIFVVANKNEIALYENGTFLKSVDAEEFLRLIKRPESFEIQYCKIEGIRTDVFERFLTLLELKTSESKKAELLDVVRPLCMFIVKLPSYVHNTKKLSQEALTVRDAILSAREPVKLLFDDLPKACKFNAFTIDSNINSELIRDFVKKLKKVLDELKFAYPELKERLKKHLQDSFFIPGSFSQARQTLAERSMRILVTITEPKLKAFCLRLVDDNLPEDEWIESLGSYLALKPPSKWHDIEEDMFDQELTQLITRFHHVESIIFSKVKSAKTSTGIRLSITQSDGTEHEQVIYFRSEEENQLNQLQNELTDMLSKHKRLGLVAASRVMWKLLSEKEGGRR
ncbi:MAG: hypothetical protein JETT_2561 [Candidatus Jettenia ecosi]|uniref:ATP-binding protein n=1 Tax=Candidatus Jettenia ecosi TaxID=2494326 RepID=A0A533QA62_9BACT|nr:MAG: hypothetical protein JETT_2561 [Candidatus Jettenia ecosi]